MRAKKAINKSCFLALLLAASSFPAFPITVDVHEGERVGGHTHPPSATPDWPIGLEKLVNRQGRIFGYIGNYLDEYFFVGDAEAFNDFLKQYANLREIPLSSEQIEERRKYARRYAPPEIADRDYPPPPPHPYPSRPLILHAGQGTTSGFPSSTKKGRDPIDFDWKISIRDNVGDSWKPVETIYSIKVELWTGGNVELDEVEVPLNVKIRSATPGQFQEFIKSHEARRRGNNTNTR